MSSMEAPPPPPSPPPATKSSAAYPSSSSLLLYSSKLLPASSPSPSPSSVSSFASRSNLTNSQLAYDYYFIRRGRLFVFTGLLLLLLFLQHYLLLPQAKPASTFLHQNVSQPQGTTGVSPEHARSSHLGDQHQNHRPLSSSHSQSSSPSSSSSQSSFDRRSKDLAVQWTEQDKVPIAWAHQVRPLIIASLPSSSSPQPSSSSQPSPSDVITRIRVTLPLNSASHHNLTLTTTTTNLSQIELILSSSSQPPSSIRRQTNNSSGKSKQIHSNQSAVDFLSPHFVFAEHLSVVDEEGESFTEERRRYDHQFQSSDDQQQQQQQSPAEAVIRRLFSSTSPAAATMCHLFTGRIVVHRTRSRTGSNQRENTNNDDAEDNENDDDDIMSRQSSSSSTATIQLCSHGSLNGIITWPEHGHLLLEPAKPAELCKVETVEEMKQSNSTSTTFHSCTHRLHYAPFSEEEEEEDEEEESSHEEASSLPLLPTPSHPPQIRSRRSVSEARTIEMMIVTDMSMWESHGESLQEYVFSLVASVAHIFRHSSIGNRIEVKLIRLYAMRPNSGEDRQQEAHFLPAGAGEDSSAQNTLRRFCHWQHAHNQADDADPRHYDIAILLTRRDLCRKTSHSAGSAAAATSSSSSSSSSAAFSSAGNVNEQAPSGRKMSCDTIGLAHSGQICDPSSSCAIVEDTGLSSAFTIAHELGHVLGIPHDDEDKCKAFYNRTQRPTSNVMARMIDIKSHMWSWSACSKHFITEYLDSGNGRCLLDDNSEDAMAAAAAQEEEHHRHQLMMAHFGGRGGGGGRSYQSGQSRSLRSGAHQESASYLRFRQPGEYYTATAQCRHVFGKSSEVCTDMPQCRRLWCTHSGLGCRTQHMPWADGTQCKPPKDVVDLNDPTDWWCQEGECVRKDVTSMRPVDGGWGDWSEYSSCSLSCGGGVSQSKRRCNRPSPKNGGKYCVGERIRYQSCATQPCDPPVGDIREQQCAAFTGKQVIKGVDAAVRWVPFHTRNPADVCKLTCADQKTGNYYQLAERVWDGTPCSPDSYHICVNGKCLAAGCDRVLGSNRTLDQCGICDGDNSTCAEVSQTVAGGLGAHGYNPVVVIPAGASNVWVRKGRSQVEENWLAIRADDGAYLLNGRWTVNKYERKWHYGGATIEYSGVVSPYNEESIHASRPIDRPIYIEILCVGELRYPEISYSYMISLGGGGKKSSTSSQHPRTQLNQNAHHHGHLNQNVTTTTYRWSRRREWTRCDRPCQGKKERRLVCYAVTTTADGATTLRQEVVHERQCPRHGRPPIEAKACNLDCELEWHVTEGGSGEVPQCSNSCGPGVRQQTVHCIKKLLGTNRARVVEMAQCEQYLGGKGRPSETVPCEGVQDCPALPPPPGPADTVTSYRWRFSEWTDCPAEDHGQQQCTRGNQTREAQCIVATRTADTGEVLAEEVVEVAECLQHLRATEEGEKKGQPPLTSRPCPPCPPRWTVSEWSECSTSCGHGEKRRAVACLHGDHPVDEVHCLSTETSKQKPDETAQCYLADCPPSPPPPPPEEVVHSNYIIDPPPQRSETSEQGSSSITLSSRSPSSLNLISSSGHHESHQALVTSEQHTPKPIESDHLHLVDQGGSPPSIEPQQADSGAGAAAGTGLLYNETIVWGVGNWTECRCEPKQKRFLRKRLVRCIRRLLDHADNQEIPDVYCLRLIRPPAPKPTELEQCKSSSLVSDDSACASAVLSTSTTSTTTTTTEASTTTSTTTTTTMAQTKKLSTRLSSSPTTSLPLPQQTPMSVTSTSTIEPTVQAQTTTLKPTTTTSSTSSSAARRTTSSRLKSKKSNRLFSKPSPAPAPVNNWTEWSDWSSCVFRNATAACGKGTKIREAKCAPGKSCTGQPKPANQTADCEWLCPIFEWHYRTEWSPCTPTNTTAGGACDPAGVRTLTAECREWTGTVVSDHFCEENSTLPAKSQPCTVAIAALDVKCSTSTSTTTTPVPETSSSSSSSSSSSTLGTPSTTSRQDGGGPRLVWQTGHWSECSQSCDTGYEVRTVGCHRLNRYRAIDPRPLLDPAVQIRMNRIVRRKRGKSGRGRGHQQQKQQQHGLLRLSSLGSSGRDRRRQQHQHRKRHNNEINYNYLDDVDDEENGEKEENEDVSGSRAGHHFCSLKTKPASIQSCFLGPCVRTGMTDSFVWRPLAWSQCDRPCGSGRQHRKVICQSVRTGAKVDSKQCKAKRPKKTRPCNRRDCGVTSCLDMRERSRTRIDGEYDLTVQGASIRVYCYGMGSLVQPLEYLQLNGSASDDGGEEEEENYSQLIHRPSECSAVTNAERSTSYEAEPSHQQRTSTLYFKYVRLNVTTLELIVGDTMFASTKETTTAAAADATTPSLFKRRSVLINERSLGFGEAVVQGCLEYRGQGAARCHFGSPEQQQLFAKFSINLQKTGLAVAPEAHWHRLGPEAYVQRSVRRSKDGKKVEGFCGLDTTLINESEGLFFSGTSRKDGKVSSVCRLGCQPVPGGAIPLIVL